MRQIKRGLYGGTIEPGARQAGPVCGCGIAFMAISTCFRVRPRIAEVWRFLCGAICVVLLGAGELRAVDSVDDLTGPWRLFVDDFPVLAKTNVVRTYHPFQKYAANPVLMPQHPWEQLIYLYGTVLPNETRTGYRMWYQTLLTNNPCSYSGAQPYATSTNGINWTKPALRLHSWCGSTSNNLYHPGFMTSVMQTPDDPDPAKRYKYMTFNSAWHGGWSSNGINFVSAPNNPLFTGGGDAGQICWDPRTKEYRCYVKNLWYDTNGLRRRAVSLAATTNFTNWPGSASLVLWPDAVDDRWSSNSIQRTHFYGMSAFPYESMYIGFLWIHRATNLLGDLPGYQVGPIHVEVVSSQDGVNWTREEGNRPPILELGANGTWDDGMVFTARAPVVEGGTLKLWYGGFDQVHDAGLSRSHSAIGLATMRKDGFASLDAGASVGTILTKTLTNATGPLHVNYQASVGGSLKVEVLDANNNVFPGYSQADCVSLTGNSVDQTVSWQTHGELPPIPSLVRLRFVLQNASVYSFMVGQVVVPKINQSPSNRTNFSGTTATFTVQAAGTEPLQYQWRKNEMNLSDGGSYSNCATTTLTITEVDESDAGSFDCVVANAGGSVTSSPAILVVTNASFPCVAIQNSDFESGFDLIGGGYIADNWTEWEAAPGVTTGYDESTITHGGGHAQRIRVWGVTNSTSGGVYQRLPVIPGQPFTVSAWIYAGDNLSACSLGVDPAGGTNAASGVIWSTATTNVAWVQKTVSSAAMADQITVFFKVAASDVNKRNGYFDDATPGVTTEPLRLVVQLNTTNLTLSWPECPPARLERAGGVLPPLAWSPVTNRVSVIGGRRNVTFAPIPQTGTDFFRLIRE